MRIISIVGYVTTSFSSHCTAWIWKNYIFRGLSLSAAWQPLFGLCLVAAIRHQNSPVPDPHCRPPGVLALRGSTHYHDSQSTKVLGLLPRFFLDLSLLEVSGYQIIRVDEQLASVRGQALAACETGSFQRCH